MVGQIYTRNLSLVVGISGLTVSGGSAVSGSNNYGGGLLNFGTMVVSNVTFSGNSAGGSGGGGIYNEGALTLNNCTFSGNTSYFGAGINGEVDGLFGKSRLRRAAAFPVPLRVLDFPA